MKMFSTAAVLALMLAGACTPPAADTAETAAAVGCTAEVSAPWRPLSGVEFLTEAKTEGATCGEARATLSVRAGDGTVLHSETYPAAEVMLLAHVEDQPAMQTALGEWIDQSRTNKATTSALPVWEANAETPMSGEFPFSPEANVDRAAYAALRERNVPLFCYVQGMESEACFALENGALTKVGVQAFPG